MSINLKPIDLSKNSASNFINYNDNNEEVIDDDISIVFIGEPKKQIPIIELYDNDDDEENDNENEEDNTSDKTLVSDTNTDEDDGNDEIELILGKEKDDDLSRTMYPNLEDGANTSNVAVVSNPTTKRQNSPSSVYPVIPTNQTSLPELLDMIDENSIFSSPQKHLKTTNEKNSFEDNCSMNSYDASSSVSICSSEPEISNDFVTDVNTLNHDVPPDSPDSGVSGSVNSTDDKCCDEDNEEEYIQMVYNKSKGFNYVANNVQKLEPMSNSISFQNNEKANVSEKIDCEDNSDISKQDQTIDSEDSDETLNQDSEDSEETSNQDSDDPDETLEKQNSPDDGYDENLLKQVGSILKHKGFDTLYQMIVNGSQKEYDYYKENPVQNETDEPSVPFVSNFKLDSTQENSSTNPNGKSYKSFDWSIKTNEAPDMVSIIKEMKINAKNLKNNDSNKKPQAFICQWLNCDWPGNYEDLADHVREIHVDLQPFLDANGKIIKWDMNESLNNDFFHDSDDSEEDEENEDHDNDSMSDDESSPSTEPKKRGRKRKLKTLPPRLAKNKNRPTRDGNSGVEEANKFVCLWRSCRVYGKPSNSRNWIERHVLDQHSGPKPFKCIWDNCGQRFTSQHLMKKHVNTHFMKHRNCDNKISDELILKQIRINRGLNIESGLNLQPSSSLITDASSSLSSLSSTKSLSKLKKNELSTANSQLDSKFSKNSKNDKKYNTNNSDDSNNNNNINYDFKVKNLGHDHLDDEYFLRVEYEFRAREAFKLNLAKYEPYEKFIQKPDGTLVKMDSMKKRKSALDVLNMLKKRQSSSSSQEIVNVFQKELFKGDDPINDCIVENEFIACQTKSDNKFYYTRQWRHPGIVPKIIPESEKNKPRNYFYYYRKHIIPESFSFSKISNENHGKYSQRGIIYSKHKMEIVPTLNNESNNVIDDSSSDDDIENRIVIYFNGENNKKRKQNHNSDMNKNKDNENDSIENNDENVPKVATIKKRKTQQKEMSSSIKKRLRKR